MTPERKEEIRGRLRDRLQHRGYLEPDELEINELVAALEEAEQTLVRQREALEQIAYPRHSYHSEAISTARAALRGGTKETSSPACPYCGSKNTIDHPTRTDIRLCVHCEKPYAVTGEGATEDETQI